MVSLDLAFVGGHVFDGYHDVAERTDVGVAVGHIAAIGSEPVADGIGPHTRVVDLTGRLLLPGMIDAHFHPIEAGAERLGCDLSVGRTKEEYLGIIAAYAEAHPAAEWIVGGGWAQAAFPNGSPQAADLDRVCPGRLVVMSNRDHHSSWVSTPALVRAGIGASLPDPADGKIDRDPSGRPTGTLHEGARLLVLRMVPAQSVATMYDALLEAQRFAHSLGITGWQDALIGDYGNHSSLYLEVYRRALQEGSLTARVSGALWWDRNRELDQVDDLIAIRAQHQSERFAITSVKMMQDGIPENGTAAVLEPYHTGHGISGNGISFIPTDLLRRAATGLDAEGFQLHFHAIGERAVRECLDAVESARTANAAPGPMHHLAHIQIVHPADIARFASVRAAATMQPLWAAYDPQMVDLNLPILGSERAGWQYPFASLLRSGAHLGAGSDWPVTSPDPWLGMHVAVNRQHPSWHPDYNDRVFIPAERLTLGEALRAYTSGSALINGRAHYTGAIRRGYAADLVVIDRNPFERPAAEIARTATVETFIEGQTVYRNPAAGG